MSRRVPVVIGDLTFATQREASEFYKKMLHKYKDYESVDENDHEILLNLIERHPEALQKIGCGIKRFFKAPTDMTTSCFWLEREDGSTTDFSYPTCIKGKGKTVFQEFMEACREAVREDLIETKYSYFRENGDEEGKVECELTGEKITDRESHLDHTKPLTFQVIVITFIKANKIKIDKDMLTKSSDGQFQTSFIDKGLREEFRRYHHDVAEMRIIKKGINLKLGPSERIKRIKKSVPIKICMKT